MDFLLHFADEARDFPVRLQVLNLNERKNLTIDFFLEKFHPQHLARTLPCSLDVIYEQFIYFDHQMESEVYIRLTSPHLVVIELVQGSNAVLQ